AHLLFEMLRGETITAGWKDDSVKEALDLCLACKGCKGDCPVNVDMATLKAEFLSHYYDKRLRPRQAYFFGLIFIWARMASYAPWLANFSTRTPLLRDVAKKLSGMAPQRTIPRFANRSFKDGFRPVKTNGEQVILWPDTFNNYFHTDVAHAAASALQAAGFDVTVPPQTLCCGRPLYDYGMLSKAKRQLEQIIDALREPIRAGRPIVVLEPSCLSVFRDEMVDLFPQDEDARRLSRQALSLSEFLLSRNVELPKLSSEALVQGHCHQQSVLGMQADEEVYKRLGLNYDLLDAGCCGMAGSFGFEEGEKYDVSVAAGEHALLPAVRNASSNTLVLADGFSCQEQIDQLTPRHALHLAQVVDMAYRQGQRGRSRSEDQASG
ncbi:MAG TPA: heterodisulfide reductase-related iron-sulfur binding cluster, partial [Dehalococcoidia bacterium]|nr:heterodisulfide reductase-related iron-sulfur binding cluster [Dehalococcoidia bacterium]